jgi:lysozyme family protein
VENPDSTRGMVMAATTNHVEARLRRIQSALGVHADGVLGPETLSALETRLQVQPQDGAAHLECSKSSLDQIVSFEVGSKSSYDRTLQSPTWQAATAASQSASDMTSV